MTEYSWYEVWVDETSTPFYFLLLLYNEKSGRFDVADTAEGKLSYSTGSYEDAKSWLSENEFTRADGRMEFIDT